MKDNDKNRIDNGNNSNNNDNNTNIKMVIVT